MNFRKLIKINEMPIHWLTKCEECDNMEFTILELTQLPHHTIAKCRCNKCLHTTKMELHGLDEKIEEIMNMEEKVIFERDEFVVKETDEDYFIEFKTPEGACVTERFTSAYPQVIGAAIPKAKYKGKLHND